MNDPTFKNDNLCHVYWKQYFDVGYYLGLIPFHFEWNESSQEWIPKKNIFQMVGLIIHTLLAILMGICFVGEEFTGYSNRLPSKNTPLFYFDGLLSISVIAYIVALHLTVWTKQKQIELVFNFKPESMLDQSRNNIYFLNFSSELRNAGRFFGNSNKNEFKKKVQASSETLKTKLKQFWNHVTNPSPPNLTKFLIIWYTFQPFLYLIKIFEMSNWNMNQFIETYSGLSRKMFFLHEKPNKISFTTFFGIFCNLYQKLIYKYVELLFVLTSIYFRKLINRFLAKLEDDDSRLIVQEVLVNHQILSEAIKNINNVVRYISFVFSICSLPFFCIILVDYFNSFQWFARIHWAIYAVSVFTSLRVAANAVKKLDKVYDWFILDNNFLKCTQFETDIFLNEMRRNEIGLTAGGFLFINNVFLRNVSGIIVTYTFVMMQLQQEDKDMDGNNKEYHYNY